MATRLLNVKEAAEMLGTTPRAIYQRRHRNLIPFVKDGKNLRFDEEELLEYIEKKKAETRGISMGSSR